LVQIAFAVILLEVHERRPTMARLGQQVEAVDELVLEIHFADVPGHPFVDDSLATAEAVPDLERSFCKADRPRSKRELVVVVDDDHAHALPREIDRGSKTDRPGADDDDRMASRGARILIS